MCFASGCHSSPHIPPEGLSADLPLGRRRKKKCDETRLVCLNCAKRDLVCKWPQNVTETGGWAGHSPPLNRQKSNDLDNGTTTAVVKYDDQTPWRTYCLDEVSYDSSDVGSSTDLSIVGEGPWEQSAFSAMRVLGGLHRLSTNPSPAVVEESGRLFDFLRVTFLPQLIRPTANGHIIDFFTQETLTLALHWPFCMHALLACCGSEIPTDNREFRRLARFHYVHAVEGLRTNLDDGNLNQQWIVTILTVLMLCIYEVCPFYSRSIQQERGLIQSPRDPSHRVQLPLMFIW